MKVVRFKEEVEELELFYEKYACRYTITDCYGRPIAIVDENRPYVFSTDFDSFVDLQDIDPEKAEKVFRLCIELARTPIDERKSEIKYYLKHKWLDKKYEDGYLNYHEGAGNFTLSDKNYDELFKTRFTEKEIEEIKEEFDISLEDFEIVEVEDEDC